MKPLRAAILSAAIGLLGAWASYSYATPAEDFARDYRDGTLFPGDAGYDKWREHTTERDIELTQVRDEETRTTAYYRATLRWDGEPAVKTGVVMFFVENGKVTGEQHAPIDPAAYDLAVAGQLADVASTVVGLSVGLTEANPLGLLALPLKYGALAYSKTLPLHECIHLRKLSGGFGWGAAAANVAAIAGLGPVGLVLGLAVGLAVSDAVEQDAPVRCVEGGQ